VFKDGVVSYEGEFVRDQFHGQGTFTFGSGSTYTVRCTLSQLSLESAHHQRTSLPAVRSSWAEGPLGLLRDTLWERTWLGPSTSKTELHTLLATMRASICCTWRWKRVRGVSLTDAWWRAVVVGAGELGQRRVPGVGQIHVDRRIVL
jgi:hypothetical protein